MKISRHPLTRSSFTFSLALASSILIHSAGAADNPASSGDKVPLIIKLPSPAFKGTPKDIQLSSYVEPLSDKPRAPMMVPPGLKNIAPSAKITCSDKNATADTLTKIVDGDKEASEQSIIYLRKGTQWVQMDFGSPQEIFAVVIWHAHNSAKVYHDVIVQVADDQDFLQNVKTVFNNDQDNTSGLGVGTDREFFETHEGKLIDFKGVTARYIRFYSKGSTESALNEYTEVEVYGRPAK
jgi:F5/8 type C domain-containing protein